MIFLEVGEIGGTKEPMGFNCGSSNADRARQIADDLRATMKGDMKIYGPEMRTSDGGDDYIITVRCQPGSLESVTRLVEMGVAIMRRRRQII